MVGCSVVLAAGQSITATILFKTRVLAACKSSMPLKILWRDDVLTLVGFSDLGRIRFGRQHQLAVGIFNAQVTCWRNNNEGLHQAAWNKCNQ